MSTVRILVVEDDSITQALIASALDGLGFHLDCVGSAEAALAQLDQEAYGLVLLDRMLPDMDGLVLLQMMKMQAQHRHTPVILQTAMGSQQEVLEGVAAGAYHYLTKPFEPDTLRIMVQSVVSDAFERQRFLQVQEMAQYVNATLLKAQFGFRTPNEARGLSSVLAQLAAEPGNVGSALFELMANAVEHGNLGIGFADKAKLRREGRWEIEIARRQVTAPWSERKARLLVERENGVLRFTVRDQGAGFDWLPFLEFDHTRAFDLSGRGIAIARATSDGQVRYLGNGNTVELTVRAA